MGNRRFGDRFSGVFSGYFSQNPSKVRSESKKPHTDPSAASTVPATRSPRQSQALRPGACRTIYYTRSVPSCAGHPERSDAGTTGTQRQLRLRNAATPGPEGSGVVVGREHPGSAERDHSSMKSMLISRWKTSCSEMKVSVEASPWMCRIPSKIVRMRCSLSTQ